MSSGSNTPSESLVESLREYGDLGAIVQFNGNVIIALRGYPSVPLKVFCLQQLDVLLSERE